MAVSARLGKSFFCEGPILCLFSGSSGGKYTVDLGQLRLPSDSFDYYSKAINDDFSEWFTI